MGSIRINELARELEVKSRAILDSLPKVGITEKKSHSSSLEDDAADKVRAYFRGGEVPAAEWAAPKEESPAPTDEAPASVNAKASAPAAAEEPLKHAEAPAGRQSFTKSIAEIKAAARKTVAPHPAARPATEVPSPTAAPERAAQTA